jgi:hypothetical protein
VIERGRLKWRGVRMPFDILKGAVQAIEELKASPIRADSARSCLAVA